MKTSFRSRLSKGDFLPGTFLCLSSPEIAEIMVEAGYKWLVIDLEHSPAGVKEAEVMLQAVGQQVDCVVRVPLNDEIWIKKVLDVGATNVMVPQVNTVEDARRAVRFCKYPPQGTRSVGMARVSTYGARLQPYLQHANEDSAVIIQIEHIQAVSNVEAILSVEGIDAVFIGPFDLSASMGLIGQVNHPDVQAAIETVRKSCQAHHVALGIFVSNAKKASEYARQGFSLVGISTDAVILGQAAKGVIADLTA
jgi:2-dehydro-3-deoxyglucarate aldolase